MLNIKELSFFGFRLVPKKELEQLHDEAGKNLVKRAELEGSVQNLLVALKKANGENTELLQKLDSISKAREAVEKIDVFSDDPIPLDSVKRREYVAQVAGLHKDILEPKFKHMISRSLLLLEDSTNDREFDLAVKGAIYFAREFIRWGNLMVSEQINNQMQGSEVTNNKED